MATSNSSDFNLTRNQIVEESFREIGVKTPNRTLTSEEMNDGARTLNLLIKSLISKGSFLWKIKQATLFSVNGQSKYVIDGATANATEEYTETTTTAITSSGASLINVSSIVGFVKDYFIGLVQDNNTIHWSTINRLGTDTVFTEDFNDDTGLTFDSDKIRIESGVAALDPQDDPSETFNQDFSSSTGFTFNASATEFTAGQLQQIDMRTADATFAATYTTDVNGTWGDGTLTGTAVGGASVSSGKLDLSSDDLRYVEYSAPSNLDGVQTGAVKFKVTPNYSGTPASSQYFLSTTFARGSLVNTIEYIHKSNGALSYAYYNSSGVLIVSKEIAWSPTSGVEYEVEFNFDMDAGIQNTFIDGVLVKNSTTVAAGARTNTATLAIVGTGRGVAPAETSNYEIDDIIFFDTLQHTTAGGNYTPGYTVPETIYDGDVITLPTFTYSGIGHIQSFDLFATTEGNAPRYVTNGQYWNGAAWVASDDSFAQANTVADVNTNISTLTAADTITMKIITDDSAVQMSVDDLTITYTGEITPYPTDNPTIDIDTAITGDIKSWSSFVTSIVAVGSDSVTFALSNDGGSTYKYWNGAWSTSDGTFAQSASATDTNTNIVTFPIATGGMKIRLFLHSDDGSTTPTIGNLDVNYGVGKSCYLDDVTTNDSASGSAVYVYEKKILRPENIQNAQSTLGTDSEIPMTQYSRDTYYDIPVKSTPGRSNLFFYDKQLTSGLMHLWPVPNSVANKTVFSFTEQLFDFDTATDDPDFPVEWLQPLILIVAYRLSRKYGRLDLQEKEQLKRDADEALEDVEGYDREETSIYFQPASNVNVNNYR